jgi:hypothetical protein
MTYDKAKFLGRDYDDLTLPQRMAAMVEARELARAEDETPEPDSFVPFPADDPRADAWIAERNKLRATPLRVIEWLDTRNERIYVIDPRT